MIRARELRIGNNLLYDGKIITVKAETIIWFQNSYHPGLYNPIELTPEILEKAGFADAEDYWIKDGFKIWDDEGKDFYHVNSETLTSFDYLHHLQNYYHALTGEELTLNL